VSKSQITNQSTTLIPALRNLSVRELFILTKGKIPLNLLQGFKEGLFKPNRHHREILTALGNRLARWIEMGMIEDYVNREKFRALQTILNVVEKDDILSRPEKITYAEKLDEYIEKHFDRIIVGFAEK
jgi:hypothetical protein